MTLYCTSFPGLERDFARSRDIRGSEAASLPSQGLEDLTQSREEQASLCGRNLGASVILFDLAVGQVGANGCLNLRVYL